MKNKLLFLLVLLFPLISHAQSNSAKGIDGLRSDYRILFYNVENLFDTKDDSLKNDAEFLPQGVKYWTWKKYQDKCKKIAKIIMAVGGWQLPEIVGLCEIENKKTLNGILYSTPLKKANYKIIHKESPDHRGIDVALLYQPDRFFPIDTTFLKLTYNNSSYSTTRDILYVKGITHTDDTLHIFVNHWPSRWGGQLESEHKRISAAQLLRNKVDTIFQNNRKAKIIIMGDFNDYPDNNSIRKTLKASVPDNEITNNQLYNLAAVLQKKSSIASNKYKGVWGMLDQFIVSGALLNSNGILQTHPNNMFIFAPAYLLETDVSYKGKRPCRTYIGYKYHGGFSDHLPVYLDLWRTLDDEK
ncbi:endonuclease [Ancylomarina sp. 16SWW S1-10-2]|uniref:endonuclease/exonuclease/phosphatase family protein n=1 Tax=Ancylomarina sp. 16SWW S1-10-2 TaxID=2499681 RepID=UPI0012AE41CF|nr:endonuclease [Ancylomarina sp. 16SWW S1-10-2]MRT91818.1 endonuclease [Ancylomarina sp. 16SWW S1-10-2]